MNITLGELCEVPLDTLGEQIALFRQQRDNIFTKKKNSPEILSNPKEKSTIFSISAKPTPEVCLSSIQKTSKENSQCLTFFEKDDQSFMRSQSEYPWKSNEVLDFGFISPYTTTQPKSALEAFGLGGNI